MRFSFRNGDISWYISTKVQMAAHLPEGLDVVPLSTTAQHQRAATRKRLIPRAGGASYHHIQENVFFRLWTSLKF